MHELIPQGFSPVLTAFLKVAQSLFPEAFDGETPDAETLGASLHLILYGKDDFLINEPHVSQVKAFGEVHRRIRQLAADGAIRLLYLDCAAQARPITDTRYWATDAGNFNLLDGRYSPETWLTWRPLLIENGVVEKLMPPKATATAADRTTLKRRIHETMRSNPENKSPQRSKDEIIAECSQGLKISERQTKSAWGEVAAEFPAYSKAGPRKRNRIS